MNSSTLTVTGANASLNVTGAATLAIVSLFADSGGKMTFSGATTYGVQGGDRVRASGVNSEIDLSRLTTLAGGGTECFIDALGGGKVDLSGSLNRAILTVDSSASALNVATVTGLNDYVTVKASSGAVVNFASATAISIASLYADSGAVIRFPSAKTYGVQGGDRVRASGVNSEIDLSRLTTLAGGGTECFIDALGGGKVDLGGSLNRAILTVDSSASTLNVATVTGLNDYVTVNASNRAIVTFSSATALSITNLYANSGAVIRFPLATSYGVSGVDVVQASGVTNGVASEIDLSHLTILAGGGTECHVNAINGGRVDLSGSLNRAILTVDSSASTLNVANVTGLNDYVTVNASGGALVSFTSATALSITNLYADSGAVIDFPSATTFGFSGSDVVRARGSESRIILAHLTTLAGGGGPIQFYSVNGGKVDLGASLKSTSSIGLTATYGSNADVPFMTDGVSGTGKTVNFSLNYAPAPGTILRVTENAGTTLIRPLFSNLGQSQVVPLTFGGNTYNFVSNYDGGTGNDLVLQLPGIPQTGLLTVNILPAGAVTAGAQWQLDAGPFQNSGTTVNGLTEGVHTLEFKTVSGWTTPNSQTVQVAANQTTVVTATYAPILPTGSLTVTILPSGAVSTGAQWQVDSGPLQDSGATVSGLAVGSHTVAFKTISGWTTPVSHTVTVAANQTTLDSGTYVAILQTGSLTVTILPAGAVSAGAQWQVDSGPFQDSGATVSGLAVGSHPVAFKTISGWTKPASHTVAVAANQTTLDSGTYAAISQTGSLTVTILPSEAVTAGAQWQVDGGTFQNSGTTVSGLSVGSHNIAFKSIAGWTPPVSHTVTVAANQTATDSGTYVVITPGLPDTTIISGPDACTNATGAVFVFTGIDHGTRPADLGFEYSLDRAGFLAASSPVTLSSLADGPHTFAVRAIDNDTPPNTDPTPAEWKWTVDTVPPDTTIASGPSGAVSSSDTTFTFVSTEANSTFMASLDGTTEELVTSPKTYLRLGPGPHTFRTRAIDCAGNGDPTPVQRDWTISPEVIIVSGPKGTVNSNKAIFAFTSNVVGTTFVTSIDNVAETPAISPKTYTGLSDTAHTFRVRSVVGNSTPVERTWRVDTVAPETTITSGPSGIVTATTATFTFTSNQAGSTFMASLDDGTPVAVSSPQTYSGLAAGIHTFDVYAIDPAGNRDQTTARRVWVAQPSPFFAKGDNAPGRRNGAALAPTASARPEPARALIQSIGSSFLPADAQLTDFGIPAIDNHGNVAFIAGWKSASSGSGKSLFTDTESIATIGGGVPGILGATYASFNDPVIESGNLAFLASLAGVPAARTKAVLSDATTPTGDLAVVARSGDVAPGARDARFQDFQAATVSGSSVAILGRLSLQAHLPTVTDANNTGIWVMDATHPMTLVLREGQPVGSKRIMSLVAFRVGDGSPGQGRGWLRTPAGGSPLAMALAVFTDQTQAVLSADLDGKVTILSQSGPGGAGGPNLNAANFSRYGVPAVNADGYSAFRAPLTVGAGGVTLANAGGIFLLTPPTLGYSPIARTGDPAGDTGAMFSAFKDPVLASDGGLAFPAMIEKLGLHGFTSETLWWKPPGDTLRLLAQAGAEPAGLPGARWGTFSSLTIAKDSGPIFSASLITGRGGVTASNSSGVWAMDSTGNLQLLFRTGDMVKGKTVLSFHVLKSVTGSLGVTRSFNDSGAVIWRATYTDSTTAIISTLIK